MKGRRGGNEKEKEERLMERKIEREERKESFGFQFTSHANDFSKL